LVLKHELVLVLALLYMGNLYPLNCNGDWSHEFNLTKQCLVLRSSSFLLSENFASTQCLGSCQARLVSNEYDGCNTVLILWCP
jgi:hypothetical protein